MHDASNEVVADAGDAEVAVFILEQVTAVFPKRDMRVAARPRQVRERLRHEGRPQAVLFGNRLHHVLVRK